jgi:hypothetical protein
LTEASREVTPEGKQSNTHRLLVASVFQSPVKSFSRAIKSSQERKAPRFLGDDSDDPDLSTQPEENEQHQQKREEDPDEWMTDGSSEQRKRKGKKDNQGAKPKVKVQSGQDCISIVLY